MKITTPLFLITLTSVICVSPDAFARQTDNPFQRSAMIARKGGVQGGGGDTATEGRIHEIRKDLIRWIEKGGARGLDFSKSRAQITYDEYLAGDSSRGLYGMKDILMDGAVVINAIRDSEMRMDDEELNTHVGGFPKTCKGFISKKDGRPHMLCNADRFWDLKPGWTKEQLEAEQYRQVHHEYASLGRLEKNSGSDSDTTLSDQITTFLKPEKILRLAVLAPPVTDQPLFQGNSGYLIQLDEPGLWGNPFSVRARVYTDGHVKTGYVEGGALQMSLPRPFVTLSPRKIQGLTCMEMKTLEIVKLLTSVSTVLGEKFSGGSSAICRDDLSGQTYYVEMLQQKILSKLRVTVNRFCKDSCYVLDLEQLNSIQSGTYYDTEFLLKRSSVNIDQTYRSFQVVSLNTTLRTIELLGGSFPIVPRELNGVPVYTFKQGQYIIHPSPLVETLLILRPFNCRGAVRGYGLEHTGCKPTDFNHIDADTEYLVWLVSPQLFGRENQ